MRGIHPGLGLVEILFWQDLLVEKQACSLINVFSFFEIGGSLFHFGSISHVSKVIGRTGQSETGTSLLIKSSLLLEREGQFNGRHFDDRLPGFHPIADVNENRINFAFDFRTDSYLFLREQ